MMLPTTTAVVPLTNGSFLKIVVPMMTVASPNTIWPVPERQLREFCAKCKKVLVPEMNIGKYVREIQRVGGYDKVVGASILGGALFTPEQILEKIKEVR